MLKKYFFIIMLSIYAISGLANAAELATHQFRLENGLNVVIREDHRAPIVAVQIWYRVGSKDEHLGHTGLSHALEHMMFQGTKQLPNAQFFHAITSMGGEANAFTSHDFTAYHEVVPVAKLATVLQYEADRMQHLTLETERFEKERQVVIEERRLRTEDNPSALAYERFLLHAMALSPYAQPVIGWMSDLDAMTVDDLRAWYERWYVPNFATVVLVGDVDSKSAQELIQATFGSIPAREPAQIQKPYPALSSLGEIRLQFQLPSLQLPQLTVAYRVPSANALDAADKDDAYALALLSTILTGGQSSLLVKQLVRDQSIAASVSADYSLYSQYPFLFTLTAIPNPTISLNTVETQLLTAIEQIKKQGIPPARLEIAKNQLIAQTIFSRDSMTDQAHLIGMFESIGLGWQTEREFITKVQSITLAQIQTVANRYLNESNRIVGHLMPVTMPSSDA